MKCKHQNGDLIDLNLVSSAHTVTKGKVDPIGWHDSGLIVGYEYKCAECKKVFKFVGNPRQKWLQVLYAQLFDCKVDV